MLHEVHLIAKVNTPFSYGLVCTVTLKEITVIKFQETTSPNQMAI